MKGPRRGPAGKERADVGEDLDEDDERHHDEGEADVEQLARGGGGVPGQNLPGVVMLRQTLSIVGAIYSINQTLKLPPT